jgi:hypothetical protein
MKHSASLEVDFYGRYKASAIVETLAQEKERETVALRLFAAYTLRQLRNMGNAGRPLAQILAAMDRPAEVYTNYYNLVHRMSTPQEMAPYMPFIAALGVDMARIVESVTAFAMLRASAGGDTEEIARNLWPEVCGLVPYQGRPGDKRFVAQLELDESRVSLQLDAKGFGLLGQGVDYFASMSVVLVLRYLTEKYDEDAAASDMSERIREVAQMCGRAALAHAIGAGEEAELVRGIK